jgi:pyruvate/2-oxoglutarate dehydrogenase complex dihydrolipoamide acyltransferase (E2) component
MPHEVIMPALGMAQDTGLLVRWLKEPGDAIAVGDPLMEVETDKSVMEVEALASGFLADLQAQAGENVPVGQVVALITDNLETTVHDIPSDLTAKEPSAPLAATLQGKEIIMPALGMAQETGLIVAWHKEVGDAVSEDDLLFEVETDKSTVEVPAGQSGFIAQIFAAEGQEVPVGSVIAMITPEKLTATPVTSVSIAAFVPVQATVIASETPVPIAPSAPSPKAKQSNAITGVLGGRVLASPKARWLALQEGLDLNRLVTAGHPQPYHVADISILRAIPEAPAGSVVTTARQITARASTAGIIDFITKVQSNGGVKLTPNMIWASFAAGAWRHAISAEETLIVEVLDLTDVLGCFEDLDLQRLSRASLYDGVQSPNLILRDLTQTAITGVMLCPTVPTVTMGQDGEQYCITFEFVSGQISDASALSFATDFTARLLDPLRHLF